MWGDVSLNDLQTMHSRELNDWEADKERFPNGLKGAVTALKTGFGIKVGIWFAPESRDHFVCMDRDIATLKNAYENWGIRFFKLDMYWIECDLDRDRFLQYLASIYAFGDDVAVQLDVTRPDRINYLNGRQYGTLFVENRYTKKRTYFPHRTLKNFWLLSKYVPASRFQFEVINPELNKEIYAPEDEFAPARYDMDYLFASVMLSNPLFWMEMQFLTNENSKKLQKMISIFKEYHAVFSEGDAAPIGETPSGRSFAGFFIRHGAEEYALVFREATEKDTGVFLIPSEKTNAQIICSNADIVAGIDSGVLKVKFSKQRAFAFVKLS
ncbi:MAG: alpha-galactosidase, partial [Clostridia bacterium]|nr:alpha-galactosidase [Clostridia bacterium]